MVRKLIPSGKNHPMAVRPNHTLPYAYYHVRHLRPDPAKGRLDQSATNLSLQRQTLPPGGHNVCACAVRSGRKWPLVPRPSSLIGVLAGRHQRFVGGTGLQQIMAKCEEDEGKGGEG